MAERHNAVTVDNPKSPAQALLERLRDIHRNLAAIALDLAAVKHSIGLPAPPPDSALVHVRADQTKSIEPPRPITQFFPALQVLADELEATTHELAGGIKDLAGGF